MPPSSAKAELRSTCGSRNPRTMKVAFFWRPMLLTASTAAAQARGSDLRRRIRACEPILGRSF